MNQWTTKTSPFGVTLEKLCLPSGLSFKKIDAQLVNGFDVEEMRAEVKAFEKELAEKKGSGKDL